MKFYPPRFFTYPILLIIALLIWYIFLPFSIDDLYSIYWPSALTMIAGSFVAGSTPMGGGALAFPVFTKIFNMDVQQAKLFGLFIQSVGMTFASVLFFSLRIPIYWRWLVYLLPSSFLGFYVGNTFLVLSGEHIKLLLSLFVVLAGVLLLKVHSKPLYEQVIAGQESAIFSRFFIAIGFPAGVLAALVGTGADTLLFFSVVILYKKSIKAVIPTTVVYMALCSLLGTAVIFFQGEIPVSNFVENSWWAAAPVVAVGAPLGGFVMSKINANYLLVFIKIIILIEGTSTLLFVNLIFIEKFILLALLAAASAYLLLQIKGMIRPNFRS